MANDMRYLALDKHAFKTLQLNIKQQHRQLGEAPDYAVPRRQPAGGAKHPLQRLYHATGSPQGFCLGDPFLPQQCRQDHQRSDDSCLLCMGGLAYFVNLEQMSCRQARSKQGTAAGQQQP